LTYLQLFVFTFDIFLGFHSGFYEFGEIVMNRKRIQHEYFHKKLFLTFFSTGLVIASIVLSLQFLNFVSIILRIGSVWEQFMFFGFLDVIFLIFCCCWAAWWEDWKDRLESAAILAVYVYLRAYQAAADNDDIHTFIRLRVSFRWGCNPQEFQQFFPKLDCECRFRVCTFLGEIHCFYLFCYDFDDNYWIRRHPSSECVWANVRAWHVIHQLWSVRV